MASWAKCDFKGLEEFEKAVNKVNQHKLNEFFEACAKELAARLLAKAIKRTPVCDYTVYETQSGKVGGTLRRGWTGGVQTDAASYANSLQVQHAAGQFAVWVTNPVEYSSYVEYGHRQTPGRYVPAIGKRLKKGWVKGRFMLTISEQEVEAIAPALLEKRIQDFMNEVFGNGS